jgi:hypothetical protein
LSSVNFWENFMLAGFRCPNCGAQGGILAEERSDIPRCPRCRTRLLLEPLREFGTTVVNRTIDDDVVLWVSQPTSGTIPKTDGLATCAACGFEGLMQYDSDRGDTICPACLTVTCARPERAKQVVNCPNCCEPIALHERDRGKTIVCKACNYFLGCVLRSEPRRTTTHRFLHAMFGGGTN